MNTVLSKEEIEELIRMTKVGQEFHFDESKLSVKDRMLLAEMNSIAMINLAQNFNDVADIFIASLHKK